jgi:hypothetical protein
MAGLLADPDPNNVIAVVEYLGRLGARDYAPAVASVLREAADPFLVVSCLEALALIGGKEQVPAVRERFRDLPRIDPVLLFPYLRFLSAFAGPEDLPFLLELIRGGGGAAGRELLDVFVALTERGLDPSDRRLLGDALIALLERDLPPADAYEAMGILSHLRLPLNWSFLSGFLGAEEPFLRMAALEAVAEGRLGTFRSRVEELLADPDPEVASLAREVREALDTGGPS